LPDFFYRKKEGHGDRNLGPINIGGIFANKRARTANKRTGTTIKELESQIKELESQIIASDSQSKRPSRYFHV